MVCVVKFPIPCFYSGKHCGRCGFGSPGLLGDLPTLRASTLSQLNRISEDFTGQGAISVLRGVSFLKPRKRVAGILKIFHFT